MNINSWLGSNVDLLNPTAETKAVLAWRRILRFPTEIEIDRNGTYLAAQTVRIEHNIRVREDNKDLTATGVAVAMVFGVKGHPTIPDTDIQARDLFYFENTMFEVTTIIPLEGEIQATCEARYG